MASNYSTNLKIELISAGEQAGTWGTTTNTNLGTALEEAIVGYGNPDFTSDADLTLTLSNSNATQVARNLVLNVTSSTSLTATRNLVVPTIEKPYVVQNNTTGGQNIIVKTSGGAGITVPNGLSAFVYADGTDVVSAISYVPTLTSGSLTLTSALSVANGGTGATTASGARTNLGSTTVGDALFIAASKTAAQQAMDTEVGVDVQAYDAGLADIAGLAVTDGNFIVGDGANWVTESGSTARASLGLGTLATVSPTGTGSSSNFLRGDNSWASVAQLGAGQSWSNPSRANNTWYQNTTGNPIEVAISLCVQGYAYVGPSTGSFTTVFEATTASGCGPNESAYFSFVVPNNYYYKISVRNLLKWAELR